jgi:uncharacterized protein
VIAAGRRGATGQYEDGERLFSLPPTSYKEFFVVEGAGHYDMYYVPEYVDQAIERLTLFYSKHIGE